MIAIKIQCGCGQKYAFDVEPVEGRLPATVACPVCGADGTAAGNAAIAQSIPVQVPTAAAPGRPLRRRAALGGRADRLTGGPGNRFVRFTPYPVRPNEKAATKRPRCALSPQATDSPGLTDFARRAFLLRPFGCTCALSRALLPGPATPGPTVRRALSRPGAPE